MIFLTVGASLALPFPNYLLKPFKPPSSHGLRSWLVPILITGVSQVGHNGETRLISSGRLNHSIPGKEEPRGSTVVEHILKRLVKILPESLKS